MILYYRELETGDYLAVDTGTAEYYRSRGQDYLEGRATALAGMASSVCTTTVSREYLRTKCVRVARKSVPEQWRRAIGE